MRWRANGYDIRSYASDHRPYHVHVFKDGKLVARFDLENRRFMEGSAKKHEGRVRKALRQVGLI